MSGQLVRLATAADLEAIGSIYNAAIGDRQATLETEPKSARELELWFAEHRDPYAVVVVTEAGAVVGWASLGAFSHRCAHAGTGEVSVYVARSHRGRGVGSTLLVELERIAIDNAFHKLVLHALDGNEPAKRLYRKAGFSGVGVFRDHGLLDGRFVDVIAMEKLLR